MSVSSQFISCLSYQICEFMYEKKHLYDKIIYCYLKDPLRKEEIFNYIHNILSIPGYGPEEKRSVWEEALEHVQELVAIDPAKAADLVSMHFSEEVRPIIDKLEDDSLVFQFLKCLLDLREGPNPQAVPRLSPDLHELHVGLLCRFSPHQVVDFLRVSQDYRLEETIRITERYSLHEATAYLLEKKGDVHGAFQVLLQTLKDKLVILTQESQTNTEEEEELPLQRVEVALGDIISLCHRSSHSLNQQQREALWFPLLEAMMSPQKLLKGPTWRHTSEALKELTMQVLNSMTSFIALPAIIQRILQDPVYGKGKLAEIQGLILGMLDTFNYEQTLLETTTNLLNHDLHWSLSHLRAAVSRGLHPRQDHCSICLQQYKRRQEAQDEIIIFSCGHLYHCQCPAESATGGGRSRSTSLAQTKVTSAHRGSWGDPAGGKLFPDITLDAQQSQSWEQLRCIYRGPSRLAILTELSHSRGNEKPSLLNPSQPGSGSIFHRENFQLKLSPPPLVEE
ncbi:hypothetical protein SKAU_G00238100 [Synaphobranchus kaupii]|uniref:Vacuolar protein sorting-associated protein 8 homolog n=1 Tax=Synaphobranchus kaupii TaxID=118154 RepID=A0A9Q1F7G3_SYNKA|nr:hypothetical protein SKAU_G00238100 [Synaphobranchus kaupii]